MCVMRLPRSVFAVIVSVFMAMIAFGRIAIADPSPATTQATTRNDSEEMIAYLSGIYEKLLASHDWMDRGLGLVSLTRMPGKAATERILKSLQTDQTPAVRMVAWQCLLARAQFLDEAQWKKWREATGPLVESGAFRGQVRVGLLRMLAAGEPSPGAKKRWLTIFAETSSQQSQDMPVLDALAECLATWRSRDLLQFLFEQLSVTDNAYRAEYVLHHAGVEAPWAGERSDLGHHKMWKLAIEDYARWWQQNRASWKEIRKPAEHAWRDMKPQFVPAPDLEMPIDRFQPVWKKEMEIGTPDLRGLDVVFVIDATGSMQWVLNYFKNDVARILRATSLVSTNPRIGLTFYRDYGDAFVTKSTPLTNKLTDLQHALASVDAHGGADSPEAVYDGLCDAIKKNPWDWGAGTRRAVVLIGDGPPHPPTQEACEDVARQCKEKGVALYVVRAGGGELPEFAAIAAAAGRDAVAIDDVELHAWPYPRPTLRENIWRTSLAPAAGPKSVDRQVLGGLLADAINPQFGDRVVPLVAIMLSLTTDYIPEKREVFGVASPPSGNESEPDPQAR
jgi:hypothetical protein